VRETNKQARQKKKQTNKQTKTKNTMQNATIVDQLAKTPLEK